MKKMRLMMNNYSDDRVAMVTLKMKGLIMIVMMMLMKSDEDHNGDDG